MVNTTITILLMITTSFFSAFAVCLNKYAIISNSSKEPISKILILSEVLIYGLSGFFIGLIATQYTDAIYMLIAISGSGGMIGQKLLYAVIKGVLPSLLNMTSKDEDEE